MNRFMREILSTGSKPCPRPPGGILAGLPLTNIPTSPIVRGKKLFNDSGPGLIDPFESPPKETSTLQTGWFVDGNGFYTLKLTAVTPSKDHFREADREAFPPPLWLYRLAFDR